MRKKSKYRIGNGLGSYGKRIFAESMTELSRFRQQIKNEASRRKEQWQQPE